MKDIDYSELPKILVANKLSFDQAGLKCGVSGATLSRLARGLCPQIKNAKKREAVEKLFLKLRQQAANALSEELESLRN